MKDFPPGFEKDAMNIAVDFDGVVHSFDKGWHDGTCYGDPIPGAIDGIKQLSKKFRVIIFTAKAKPSRPLVQGKTGIQLVEEWLDKHGVLSYVSEITSEKPRAWLYIDDKGYRFLNWHDTLSFVENNHE
jgi:hypothetical protein